MPSWPLLLTPAQKTSPLTWSAHVKWKPAHTALYGAMAKSVEADGVGEYDGDGDCDGEALGVGDRVDDVDAPDESDAVHDAVAVTVGDTEREGDTVRVRDGETDGVTVADRETVRDGEKDGVAVGESEGVAPTDGVAEHESGAARPPAAQPHSHATGCMLFAQ